MKLTKNAIKNITATGREQWIGDPTLPGFGVRVTPAGAASFCLRYRTEAGSTRRMVLASVDVMTLDEARDRAREHLVSVSDGRDPARERSDPSRTKTVADLAAAHQAVHRPPVIKAGTAKNYEILWRRHIVPRIGTRRVADLTVLDIKHLHMDMAETPYNANRALEVLSMALAACEDWGWRPMKTNPCDGVQAFPEKERQRILEPAEIKRLMAACDQLDGEAYSAWSITWLIRLLVLSGLRSSEWSCAQWSWVNMERGTLTLPDSKTGGRVVHLSDAVLEVLRDLRQFRPHVTPWVIPNSEFSGPLRWPYEHWDMLRGRVDLGDVRIHDLRHTLGSLGHMAGLTQREIADMLGHKQLRTTERYLHSYDSTRRDNAQVAASKVLSYTR